jgi:hypothetical protein
MRVSFWKKPLWKQVGLVAIWSAAIHGSMLAAEWYAVSPVGYGGVLFLSVATFAILPLCAALLTVPVGAIGLAWQRTRRHSATLLLCALVYLPFGYAYFVLGHDIRMGGFEHLAARSRPLVQAIRDYSAATGHPPASLDDLVPQYLPAVPGTGMPCYPRYEYSADHPPDRWDGNPWVLYVHTTSGVLGFDMFMYFPLQNYPKQGYGGGLERVGDWAYVHE